MKGKLNHFNTIVFISVPLCFTEQLLMNIYYCYTQLVLFIFHLIPLP